MNYPKHKHPHSVNDTVPNDARLWVCEECDHILTDDEARDNAEWGHPCKHKPQRCESHLEPYVPEVKP